MNLQYLQGCDCNNCSIDPESSLLNLWKFSVKCANGKQIVQTVQMYLIRYALINVQAKTCPYTWVVPFQINQISKTTPAQIIVFCKCIYLFILEKNLFLEKAKYLMSWMNIY